MVLTQLEKVILAKINERGGKLYWLETNNQETQALMRLVRKGVVIRIGESSLGPETYWEISPLYQEIII